MTMLLVALNERNIILAGIMTNEYAFWLFPQVPILMLVSSESAHVMPAIKDSSIRGSDEYSSGVRQFI